MAEFPALPLFTDAYLADTRHLTTEEHGAYLLLLMCAWRTRGCGLQDDEKALARITGLSPTRWRRMRPVLEQFFDTSGGIWQQKKLQQVYDGVAERVARNRQNGAKGGHVSAIRRDARSTPTKVTSAAGATDTATKTKSKTKSGNSQSRADGDTENCMVQGSTVTPEHKVTPRDQASSSLTPWLKAAAAAFSQANVQVTLDPSVFHMWHAAGVDPALDMVPTIQTILERGRGPGQTVPRSLGYFREAVLDAYTQRVRATEAGKGRVVTAPVARKDKRIFDPTSSKDWRQVLGDPGSRFRGDYMAKNWHIPSDHPVFRAAELGPNPRLTKTDHLPDSIIQAYRRAWCWL